MDSERQDCNPCLSRSSKNICLTKPTSIKTFTAKEVPQEKVPGVVIGDVSHHHCSLSATSPATVLFREGSGLFVWGLVSSKGSDFSSSDCSSGFFS